MSRSNLDESLQDKKPVRWELYSFVRYILELNTEITIDEIKEWFSRYPWYREDVTEYQARYEKTQTKKDGERPLPISCNNDNKNWEQHCIGKENCEYSLYRSVELKPDVYERVREDSD
ncbi:MAG: primase-associated protein [Halobacteriaceae archaeon]